MTVADPDSVVAWAVAADAPCRLTLCGVRAPQEPFVQERRKMADFIAFLVIKGEIRLTDELPGGSDQVRVRAGEVHLAAPGWWQASTRPFPPGMVFLWFHFAMGPFEPLTAEAADSAVRQLYQAPVAAPSPRWLIPRHLALGDGLESMIRDHGELLETVRLWGHDDRGSQVLGAALVHRLHRAFVGSRLHGQDIERREPELVHVGRAASWIRLHHEQPIALAEVAAAVGLGPAHLSRCFKRVTGRTVGETILDARIASAKRLLLEGHSVKATAWHAGFGSASYLCRQFKRVTGTTPQAWMRSAAHRDRRP